MKESPHIFLIDDEEGVLRALELMLTTLLNYRVSTFSDPRQAIELLAVEKPDWLICDLRMPEVDGFGVLEARNSTCPDTPFILISGHATEADAQKAKALGALTVLKKPFSPQDLQAVIEAHPAKAVNH